MPGEPILFVEKDCQVGGIACSAWCAWSTACEDTDPDAAAEQRDPKELCDFPFDPKDCECPKGCALFERATT